MIRDVALVALLAGVFLVLLGVAPILLALALWVAVVRLYRRPRWVR